MTTEPTEAIASEQTGYQIVGLSYFTLYILDVEGAVAFYSRVFGAPGYFEGPDTYGWRLGSTWLTVFPARGGSCPGSNPRNAEFAIQVSAPEEVNALYAALIEAGARPCMPPSDTVMYERMRYCCVDDPFGVRIDVYFPLTRDEV